MPPVQPPARWSTGVLIAVVPAAVCAACGWAVWRVFAGGLIGADGEWQVDQALAGTITDWLSPVMTVVLRQGLFRFYALAPLVLIQAVVGCLGLYHLARAAIRFLYPGLLSPGREAAVAVGVLLVLLLPPSPLPYYLVYVQSDGWLIPGLAWSVAGWLNLELTRPSADRPGADRLTRAGWWAAAALGAGWAVLMRHNTIVLLPVFAGLGAAAAYHRGRVTAAAAAAGVAALPLTVGWWVGERFRVERLHPEDQIMALDLVGVCVEREDLRPHLPYTDRHLIEGRFREHYVPGFVNVFYWYHPAELRPTHPDYVGVAGPDGVQRCGTRHAELAADYRAAVRHAPFTLAAVKLKAFLAYTLNDHPGEHWHPTAMLPDRVGRLTPDDGAAARAVLRQADQAVGASPALRFLGTSHLPWLVLNGLALVVVGYVARHERAGGSGGRWWRVGFLVLLLPAAYYASHLLAVAGAWYRYMYPATLLVQVGVLVAAAGAAVVALRRLRALALEVRAPVAVASPA